MTMPIDLVLVRHDESESNLARKLPKRGRRFPDELRERPTSKVRLTDKGREQAWIAGEWIRKNIFDRFDRYYTSEFIRAMETAAHLDFAEARWCVEFYLRERDWGGILGTMPDEERKEKFAEEMRTKEMDAFFWIPPEEANLLPILA